MVSGSRPGGPAAGIDDGVRKTIQSIKEIVGNHSDADIFAALKEANMDADETAQRLLFQDPFHEVKRRRDRKKEDAVFGGPVSRRKPVDDVAREVKSRTQTEHNVRRGGYSRNSFPRNAASRNAFPLNSATGTNKEFRVVRDNRSNPIVDGELKHSSAPSPGSNIDKVRANVNEKGSAGSSANHKPPGDQYSNRTSNAPVGARSRQARDAPLNSPSRKDLSEEKQTVQDATLPSSNSLVGVYSSSTDPVHVPSPDSRTSVIGAIRREVRGGGFAGKPSENVVKDSSALAGGLPLRKDGAPQTYRPFSPISKMDQLNQTTGRESVMQSGAANNRSLLNSQHGNRGSQYVRSQQQAGGHPKVSQIKEWKPKLNQKSGGNNPGVIGTPKKSSAAPADDSINSESEAVKLQDKLSHVNISESQNVIIAEHIRVPETDRCQLTFGSFLLEIDSSRNSAFQEACLAEEHERESAPSLPVAPPESSNESAPSTKPVDILNDQVRNSGSGSPVSTASEQQLPEQKEDSRTTQNLDEYVGIELLSGNGPPYTSSESKQQQDTPNLQNFSQAYDPQTGYDFPYFRPSMDENIRGQGLPSPQEALNTHNPNGPASTIPMMPQQPTQMAQMYQQVHVSHFPNLMPYRQFLPPVYVPQMPMQGYSGNPAAYAHPSNGNSYVLMPGGSSHLSANGIKYGIQPFKPVPTGGPTGFGSFNNPNGYPINSPGVVGNTNALEDSSRMKYKDGNIYVPNPQAESSEIWMQNPRDLTGLQSPPYYNVAGQTPHGAYLSSHTAHPSFNAAAAQSSHMQFQGLFHPQQPGGMASAHHMGPALGGNVGVGVAPSPAPQVGAYQQPQLGHLNWPTNF